MKILTLLIAVLPLMFGACGEATDADTAPVSVASASAPDVSSDTPEASQSIDPADSSTERCHGKCCAALCRNGAVIVSAVPKCGACVPYGRGFCATRGGFVTSTWGACP